MADGRSLRGVQVRQPPERPKLGRFLGIQTELCLADLSTVEKTLQRSIKAARSGNDKEAAALVKVLEKCQAALDQAQPVRSIDFSKEERAILKPLCLITAKPAMFVGNVSEDGFENNPFLDRLKEFAAKQNAPVVAIDPRSCGRLQFRRASARAPGCSWAGAQGCLAAFSITTAASTSISPEPAAHRALTTS